MQKLKEECITISIYLPKKMVKELKKQGKISTVIREKLEQELTKNNK